MSDAKSRRTAIIGALTLAALAISLVLAIRARDRVDVPLVIVAPKGTAVEVDGERPRVLPQQPGTSTALDSYYFMTAAGEHEVNFQEPGRPARRQSVTVQAGRMPVIYTLLRDTLREMQQRTP